MGEGKTNEFVEERKRRTDEANRGKGGYFKGPCRDAYLKDNRSEGIQHKGHFAGSDVTIDEALANAAQYTSAELMEYSKKAKSLHAECTEDMGKRMEALLWIERAHALEEVLF